ncbi:MAG: DUF2868 domain-containing protein [Pseudomonadota bacterium]
MSDDFQRRLLSEAIRETERSQGHLVLDHQAERLACDSAREPEQRLLTRAEFLPQAASYLIDFNKFSSIFFWLTAGLCGVALLGGVLTAQSAMGPAGAPVTNIYWALISLLGVQSIALVFWLLVLSFFRRPGRGFNFGSAIWALTLGIFHKSAGLAERPALWQALGSVMSESGAAKWRFGLVSHLIWLAFGMGAALTLLILLSTHHYLFAWETTILSPESFRVLTAALAKGPGLVGFSVPDGQSIAQSQWPFAGEIPAKNGSQWSGFLVGALVVYGLLPRLLLAIWCWVMEKRAKAAYRLDLTHPEYQQISARLDRLSTMGRKSNDPPEDQPASSPWRDQSPPSIRLSGKKGLLGLEIAVPKSGWPPQLSDRNWADLGLLEDRDDRQRIGKQLLKDKADFAHVTVIVDLTATPDRGICNFLGALQGETGLALFLVLTGESRMRQRADELGLAQRLKDWQNLAAMANIPKQRLICLDLDQSPPHLALIEHLHGAAAGATGL